MNTQVLDRPIELSDLFCLEHCVEILVPSTIDANIVAQENVIQEVIDYVADTFATKYGGSRVKPVEIGRWISGKHGRILEPCIPVVVYCDTLDVPFIVDTAHYVKDTLRQESVMIVVDGKGYLV